MYRVRGGLADQTTPAQVRRSSWHRQTARICADDSGWSCDGDATSTAPRPARTASGAASRANCSPATRPPLTAGGGVDEHGASRFASGPGHWIAVLDRRGPPSASRSPSSGAREMRYWSAGHAQPGQTGSRRCSGPVGADTSSVTPADWARHGPLGWLLPERRDGRRRRHRVPRLHPRPLQRSQPHRTPRRDGRYPPPTATRRTSATRDGRMNLAAELDGQFSTRRWVPTPNVCIGCGRARTRPAEL